MTMSDEYPDCPECETDVYVDTLNSGSRDYRCWFCNVYWSQNRAGNGWGVVTDLADAPQTGQI